MPITVNVCGSDATHLVLSKLVRPARQEFTFVVVDRHITHLALRARTHRDLNVPVTVKVTGNS